MKASVSVVTLLLSVVLAFVGCKGRGGASGASSQGMKEGTWQAVYLTDGQVYYGQLKEKGHQFYVLADAHTIQVTGNPGDKKQPPRPQLVRLGNDLIGLVDEISINRDRILFLQGLKNDSQVVQAILRTRAAVPPAGTATPPIPTPPIP